MASDSGSRLGEARDPSVIAPDRIVVVGDDDALALERDVLSDSDRWLTADFVGSTLFLIVVGSLIGFTAYSVLLGRWGARCTSIYAFLTPIIGVAVGVLIGDESLTIPTAAGTAIILLGILIVRRFNEPPPVAIVDTD